MSEDKMIAVVALRRGLYLGAVYEAGEQFVVSESLMTAKKDENGDVVAPRWFEPVKPAADESVKPAADESVKPAADESVKKPAAE